MYLTDRMAVARLLRRLIFDRTFGVFEPKREPRPGAEWSGLRSARPRRLDKETYQCPSLQLLPLSLRFFDKLKYLGAVDPLPKLRRKLRPHVLTGMREQAAASNAPPKRSVPWSILPEEQ
jgi:hypothetical protein